VYSIEYGRASRRLDDEQRKVTTVETSENSAREVALATGVTR